MRFCHSNIQAVGNNAPPVLIGRVRAKPIHLGKEYMLIVPCQKENVCAEEAAGQIMKNKLILRATISKSGLHLNRCRYV